MNNLVISSLLPFQAMSELMSSAQEYLNQCCHVVNVDTTIAINICAIRINDGGIARQQVVDQRSNIIDVDLAIAIGVSQTSDNRK